ncbi:poly(rC)-binding protein 3 isoform X4 [Drosophila serrata]|uniref:poly(rC)-binding protein 3 isoform X4 n=1 Tax=Drosophila serrata TaxID=7274 RepID=UPI000A1D3720|nr:poly(rC)-binding protein 3 isoform X4 [Drosophila serrata]
MEDNNTSSSAGGASIKHEDPSVTLTIRLIMQGKEVGSIIGKKGEIVNRFREESGAKINISDGSCPERIVTVSGTTNAIFSAFTLITKKFEEWCSQFNDVGKVGKTQIPIRLIVPASQCGSLIGKSGSKIKEIRQTTGCSIQVASEMLPNSTERSVTLSGSAEQITQCIYQICLVMLESPPRGATIPYRPKPQVTGPVILANGQAFTIQGNYAVPTQETCPVFPLALATGGLHAGISGLADPLLKGAHLQGAVPAHHHHLQQMPDSYIPDEQVAKNPLASLAALGLAGMNPASTGGINHTALAALAGSQLRTANPANRAQQQQHEMTVSNDLIGCIIGKGGTKIAEIRQISGAMIRISNCEEREGGNTDRTITISGNPDSVALAQYLINMSVELQKANLLEQAQAQQNGGAAVAAAAAAATAAPGAAAAVTGATTAIAGAPPSSGTNGAITTVALTDGGTGAGTGTGGGGAVAAGAADAASNGTATATNGGTTNRSVSAVTVAAAVASVYGRANGSQGTNEMASVMQLLTRPEALSALSNLSALDLLNLTTLGSNGGAGTPGGPPVQTTGVNRAKGHYATSRFRQHLTETGGEAEKPRNKFNPY